ncbi:thioredoxin family protein [Sungkyunkwania multivorans]|uniref:Thioredoxin family protein n=1 Tax=Sungkyunkwania multivorans TaxID=1173618 RepID=A0ABW3CTC7_9FLAO
MEVFERTVIDTALDKAMSYSEYKALVSRSIEKGLSTGPEQSEALLNYSKLNDRRMKRLDKTIKLSEKARQRALSFRGDVIWLVLTESWCGDAAQTMPVIDKIAALNEGIDFKVVLRDDNLELMDQFLTNGNRAIPKLIAIDKKDGEVIGEWGPRPTTATLMVKNYKEQYGKLTPEFKQELQVWYNKDRGQDTERDIIELLG